MEVPFENADMVLAILKLLSIGDVIRYRSVCSEWRKLIDQHVLKEVILQIDGVPEVGVWRYNSERMDPNSLICLESLQVLADENFQFVLRNLRRLCVNALAITEQEHELFAEIEHLSKLEHFQIITKYLQACDGPPVVKHQNLKTFSTRSRYENAFYFPNLEFLSCSSFRSKYGLENLRHLIVSHIDIPETNELKNLEILELIYVLQYAPIGQIVLWLPKLKELHIQQVACLNAARILESVREAMKKKSFKFFYSNVEFCDELMNEPHYFSDGVFTEYQLYFLQKYWSRLSSRPIHRQRLHYIGDLFRGLDVRFIGDKLASVNEIKLSQVNWWFPEDTFSSQDELVSFLGNFKYLQALYLEVCSVRQSFYDSLPDLHPYLQRLYFGILQKAGTYEAQMQLPDLNFLTRFKYLLDFDSHHLNLPEEWMNLKNLMPILDEHQKLIIDRIKKKGSEVEKREGPNFWLSCLEGRSSSEEFKDSRKDYIHVPSNTWNQLNNRVPPSAPPLRYYRNVLFIF